MFGSLKTASLVAAVGLLSIVSIAGGSGIWTTNSLSETLYKTEQSSELLRNHLTADMMHDAIKADILSILIASQYSQVNASADVAALEEHATMFRLSIAEAKSLAATPVETDTLAKVEVPLEEYITAAEAIAKASQDGSADPSLLLGDFLERYDALAIAMASATDAISTNTSQAAEKAHAFSETSKVLIIAVVGGALLLIALLGVAVSNFVVKPILNLSRCMDALSKDDRGVEVPSVERRDEIGVMARALLGFKEAIIAKMRLEEESSRQRLGAEEQRRQQEKAREEELNRQKLEAERARTEALQRTQIAEQEAVVSELKAALDLLANGDLTVRLSDAIPKSYEALRVNFNSAIRQLNIAMGQVVTEANSIQHGVHGIAAAVDNLARRTESQAANLEETAAALNEISTSVSETVRGIKDASDTVRAARAEANKSGEVVRNAIGAMSAIEDSSQQIANIISVIDEIAFQTNLLALNAGVEAARAGDAGRGFAVVASEVRGLAQRSADAAREIKQLIQTSGQHVKSGSTLVSDAGTVLIGIVERFARIDEIMDQVNEATRSQATSIQEVNTAVSQVDQITQQNAAMVEETNSASHDATADLQALMELVGRFKTSREQDSSADMRLAS
jgi:methyl-accepting chemotaxis protein